MKKLIFIAACVLAASLTFAGCSNVTAASAAANRYAIVIGVQDYPGTSNDLHYPDDDAESMASLLASKGWTVVSELISANGTTSPDGSPTHDKIRDAILGLSARIGTNKNSTVLVYYSGHGGLNEYDNNVPCIIPYDGLNTDGYADEASTANWISAPTLTSWLGNLNCKNKILILDSCYSGGFADAGDSVDGIPSSYGSHEGGTESSFLAAAFGNFGTLLQNSVSSSGDPTVLTITAAGADEYSYDDSEHGHGAFTYYLLKAATDGDSDGDGYVTVTEAYAYAKKGIEKVWNTQAEGSLDYWCGYAEWYMQHYYSETVHCSSWNDVLHYLIHLPDFMPHISGGTGDLVLYDNN